MITCQFEDGGKGKLRHVTVGAILLDKTQKKILMVKRASFLTNPGKLGLPGGFLDRNETTSSCIVREIREETGYEAELDVLFRVNDNPQRAQEDRQNVDFVFIAHIGEKVQEKDKETAELVWIDLNKIPLQNEFAFDHYETVQLFLEYVKNPKIILPIFNKI